MVLYFSKSFSSFIRKDIKILFLSSTPSLTLNVSTYQLILDNINTNGLITLFKYPIKYLELVFVSTNVEMTKLLTSTSQVFKGFFAIILLLLLSRQISALSNIRKIVVIIF